MSFETILELLRRHKYIAMFGVLFLSGMGLPVPEEVVLIASGLAVGWKEAAFLPASIACVLGIIGSDCFLFMMGRCFAPWFLARRPIRWVLTPKRMERSQRLFEKHGNKSVFIARFFTVLRLGVFIWAGQHKMPWTKFLLLDVSAAIISGPLTILVGAFAARQLHDPQRAAELAGLVLRKASWGLYAGLAGVLIFLWIRSIMRKRRLAAEKVAASARQDMLPVEDPVPTHKGDTTRS